MNRTASRLFLASILTGILVGLTVAVFELITVDVVVEGLFELPLWAQVVAPGLGLVHPPVDQDTVHLGWDFRKCGRSQGLAIG